MICSQNVKRKRYAFLIPVSTITAKARAKPWTCVHLVSRPAGKHEACRQGYYCFGSMCVTVNCPPTFSATKLTLSPCLTFSSAAGSCT